MPRKKAISREKCDYCWSKIPWKPRAKRRCLCHGFSLDLGCGPSPQPGFVGADKRAIKGVNIVMDIEEMPWCFKSNTVTQILLSHVFEHIKPWLSLDVFNEMWRVMQEEGQLLLVVPHGQSYGMLQDPTHINFVVDATFDYFCPDHAGPLYNIYNPLPWRLLRPLNSHPLHSIEAVMAPIKNKKRLKQLGFDPDEVIENGVAS